MTNRPGLLDRLFELRMLAAILFGIYGAVCLVWGIGFTTAEDLRKAGGVNVNIATGIAMLVAAAGFATWALLAPLEQPQKPAEE